MVNLFVEGKKFTSWKNMSVTRSLEAASGAFQLSLIEEKKNIPTDYIIKEGSECRLEINNITVITGYIDSVKINIDSDNYSLSVSGRDKTADLIDCSVYGKTEIRNKSLLSIARELCKPFNIVVLTDTGLDAGISVRLNPKAAKSIAQKARQRKKKSSQFAGENIKEFKTQPGETVLECLERVAKEKGLLITSTPNGELLFTRSGNDSMNVTIEEGINLLAGDIETNSKDRFSKYIVNGMNPGTSGVNGNRWKAFKSEIQDPAVKRYRPLVILAENAMGQSGARRRAVFESAVRAAKGTSVNITVPDWTTDKGDLWEVNKLVKLKSPSLRIDRELLITEVTYNLSDSGMFTELTLKRPDAYKLETDFPIENNEVVKPKSSIPRKSKKPSIKPVRRKRSVPKPTTKSRDLVMNTATQTNEVVA